MSARRSSSASEVDAPGGGRVRRLLRRLPRGRALGISALVVLLVTSPFWGPAVMSHMAFFRVRRVQVEGARYTAPRDILRQLHVDTTMSVWTDLAPLEARVAQLPEVRSAVIRRKLPGTLVVTVAERVPVALVPTSQGLQPYDQAGLPLPVDPSRVRVDAPVLMRRDTAALRLLGELRQRAPELFQRLSDVRRMDDELDFGFDSLLVRAQPGVTVARLEDVIPVQRDLARRQMRVAELDLRYRDQVIARLK